MLPIVGMDVNHDVVKVKEFANVHVGCRLTVARDDPALLIGSSGLGDFDGCPIVRASYTRAP